MRLLSLALLVAAAAAFNPSSAPAVQRSARRALAIRAEVAEVAEDTTEDTTIVSFTENALSQLTFMREKQGLEELTIRMGVRAGGCSGMSYIMDVMKDDDIGADDTVVNSYAGIRCAIDPKSLMFLYGLHLDYSDALIGGGFAFSNPNAVDSCGCGKSFGV